MANNNRPRGLVPAGPLLSAKMCSMSAAYAQALYIGDPVRYDGTSIVIATAGTGNAILGAAIGFFTSEFVPLTYSYHVASTAGTNYVLVADDPRQLFMMQEDSVGGTHYALTDISGNSNLVAGAGGSTTSGWSSWMADSSSTPGSTAGDQIRLIDILRRTDNAVGNYCKWIVRINNHQGLQGIVGVGI